MKEAKIVQEIIDSGISVRAMAKELDISEPTLYKRLKDGKFNKFQVELIKTFKVWK